MNFNVLLARVRSILLTPRAEWPVIETETTTAADLYKNYIIILAAIPAVFGFIKGSLIGIDLPLMGTMRVGIGAGIAGMLTSYVLSLVQVFVIALIVDALAPTFGGQKNQAQALKLAAYAFTAAWVAALGQIVPWLGGLIALIGGLYSIYLFYLGLPVLMKCPPERAVAYTAVVIIVTIVLSVVIGLGVAAITGTGSGFGSSHHVASSDVQFDKDSPMGKLNDWTQKMEKASKQVEAAQKSGDASAQSAAVGQMLGAALGGGDKVEALAPDKLKPFIPNSLDGLPRTSMSVQRNGTMGMQISEAKATYADKAGRTLNLDITDTGSAKGLMALAGFASMQEDKETDSGYSKTYKNNGRITHEQWDNSGHGEYTVVVGDRFTVKLDGNAKSFDDLKNALNNDINLSGLEAMKDEGVASDDDN